MTEQESLAFWGDLAKPTAEMLNMLAVQGQLPMVQVLRAILHQAEKGVLSECERCAKVCEQMAEEFPDRRSGVLKDAAGKMRAQWEKT